MGNAIIYLRREDKIETILLNKISLNQKYIDHKFDLYT